MLLLRLLLLAGLALWLAQPVLRGHEDLRPYVVVADGVDAATLDRTELPADARLHRLAEGLPVLEIGGSAPVARPQPLASLLRQLDAELPAGVPLTVVVPETIDGTDAQRPRLSRTVDWRIVAGQPAPSREPAATARPFIRHDGDAAGLRYLRAAAIAWHAQGDGEAVDDPGDAALSIGPATQPLEDASRPLLWLAAGELPAHVRDWIRGGGTALVGHDTIVAVEDGFVPAWKDADGTTWVEARREGHGRLLRFTVPLQPPSLPVVLEAGFPRQLLAVLQPEPPAPALAAASAYLPETAAADRLPAPQPLRSWLAVLLAAVFVLERWLATQRRRGPSP